MRLPSITALVGNELDGAQYTFLYKFSDSVQGADDCIYGILGNARRVVKFNPADKSLKEIGPEFGLRGITWTCGILAGNGCIYCIPFESLSDKILKIDTVNGTVAAINVNLPERGGMCWCSGALVLDGCTYFMPYNARRILKFDPEEESTANVGERLGDQHDEMEMNKYYEDMVLGNNGWLYGIPYGSNRIVRFNPADHATSTVGEAITNYFCCKGGVLGRDGFIYVVDDHDGRVLKIDVVNNIYSFVGGNLNLCCLVQSGKIVLGNDGCIYWPPNHASRLLKYDPETQEASLVGYDFRGEGRSWASGAVSSDGVI
jgi:hypothetical protein